MNEQKCCCGLSFTYSNCCELLHNGQKANTPEALMRSRYSAFAKSKVDYLWFTSSAALQNGLTKADLKSTCDAYDFVKLEVINAVDDQVEFIASMIIDNELHQIHEVSQFILEDDDWKYDAGNLRPTPVIKIGRNDLCPCGSDKKFKKCHMN